MQLRRTRSTRFSTHQLLMTLRKCIVRCLTSSRTKPRRSTSESTPFFSWEASRGVNISSSAWRYATYVLCPLYPHWQPLLICTGLGPFWPEDQGHCASIRCGYGHAPRRCSIRTGQTAFGLLCGGTTVVHYEGEKILFCLSNDRCQR